MKRVVLALSFCLAAAPAVAGTVELISRANPAAAPAVIGRAYDPAVSDDGRYVAFVSNSPNLVPGQVDANGDDDVFLRDRQTGTVTLVSRSSGSPAVTGNARSSSPSISADGRWVAFQSGASNLAAGQTSFTFSLNVFLFDRTTGTVTLVSHAHGNATQGGSNFSTAPLVSADGSRVVYLSLASDLVPGFVMNSNRAFYLWDRATNANTLVDHVPGSPNTTGNDEVTSYALSGDGRYVAFSSRATDLVAGIADGNGGDDAFLFDATTGTSTLISYAAGSATTTAGDISFVDNMSGDGRYVVLRSEAANLAAGQVDSNGASDVFLWDRDTGASTLVSHTAASAVTAAGSYGGRVSADGGWIAFGSAGLDVVAGQVNPNGATGNLFLWQRATNASVLVSHAAGSNVTSGNGAALDPDVSSDGAYVAFIGTATDHIAGGTDANFEADVFLWTRSSGAVALASRTAASATTTGDSFSLVLDLSGDGGSLAFASSSSDLVVPDGNTGTGDPGFLPGSDVFVFDRAAGTNTAASFSPAAASDAAGTVSIPPLPSRDGRYVLFASQAANLVPGMVEDNGADDWDVYLHDRRTGATTLVSRSFASPATTGDGHSYPLALSDDGAWVLFLSNSTNLTSAALSSSFQRAYLYNRQTGAMTSLGTALRASLSADGRYVAYSNFSDVFLYDRETGVSTLASHTAASPTQGAGVDINANVTISGDGRYVLFSSLATSIVSGYSDTNSAADLFLWDRLTGGNLLVSRSATGSATANAASSNMGFGVSDDGRYILFLSHATDLVAGQTDSVGTFDLFLFDRVAGTTALVSHAAGAAATAGNGRSSFGSLSRDGRYAAFTSASTNLVTGQVDTNGAFDLFLWDRAANTAALVSHLAGAPLTAASGGESGAGLFSADGTALAFVSDAPDLIAGQSDANGSPDVFLYDLLSGSTRLVTRSTASPLVPANGSHSAGLPDGGGDLVVFASSAPDLVAGNDVNQEHDVFAFANGRDYFTVAPCRLLDTRQPADGPALVSGATETLTVPGRCGIPASARAIAVNVTVTQPSAGGHLTFGPGGAALPLASTINFGAGQTRANNAILPLNAAAGGTLAVQASVPGGGTVHVIVDVVGYFE